jgi:hypothetical protein
VATHAVRQQEDAARFIEGNGILVSLPGLSSVAQPTRLDVEH